MKLPPSPFLYPIVDVTALGNRPVGEAVAQLVRAGVGVLQIRGKALTDRRLLEVVGEACRAAHAGGARLIVNDRPDVARLAGADGVHLGQEDLAPRDARSVLPEGALVGLSTHTLDQLRAALDQPVDYVAVGPVYPTRSKERPDPVVGPGLVAAARGLTRLPLVAIGGIARPNALEVVEAGADGLAVISDLLSSSDLEQAAREFLGILGRAARPA